MSTLTKVFVILLAVFSIGFTMSAISFVVQTNDWKDLADKYQAQTKVVEAHMRNLASSHAAEKATWIDIRDRMTRDAAELEASNERQAQELARLTTELAAARGESATAQALSRQLAAELEIAQNAWQEESQTRVAIEQRKLALERWNQDLDNRISEQENQIAVMEQEKRQLEQQIHILKTENKKLAQAGKQPPTVVGDLGVPGVAGRVLPLSETTGTPIRGRIVEIGGERAAISVGSSDGVEAGMVFVIYRGGEYIGDLKITDVEPNLAAGRITLTRGTPKVGDLVADESRLGVAN